MRESVSDHAPDAIAAATILQCAEFEGSGA